MFFSRGPQLLDDVALVGQRDAEIAVQHAEEPAQVARVGGLIEAEFMAEGRKVLLGGALAQNRGRDVARAGSA